MFAAFQNQSSLITMVEMKRHLKEHVVMYYSTSARQGFFVIFWDIQLIDTLVFIIQHGGQKYRLLYGLRFPSLPYNLAKTRSRMATTITFSRQNGTGSRSRTT